MLNKKFNMIVAVDSAFGIGKNNDLPWRLPKEYAHFVKQTTETVDKNKVNAVIMGSKCWQSIPEKFRPLKKRINVILSKKLSPLINNQIIIVNDYDEALRILTETELFKDKIETIWNIGGSEIYKIGLSHPWMHKLVLTKINKDYNCDVQFPQIKWENFELNNDFLNEKHYEDDVVWQVYSYTKKI